MAVGMQMSLGGIQIGPPNTPATGPKDYSRLSNRSGTIQQNSAAYRWFYPMDRGWVQPDAGFPINGGVKVAYAGRPMLPQPFPVGNRSRAVQTYGILNTDGGGDNLLIVPPDKFWRLRTSPRQVKDVRVGLRQSTTRPSWWPATLPLSFGG